MRVLLVEDNAADARLVREMLRDVTADSPVEVAHVTTLADARERLRSEPPDMVLLDLHLPDGVGLSTLRAVTEVDGGIPVVLLTGRDDEEFAGQALRAGAQDYLVKQQIDDASLVRTLRYARERKSSELALRESEANYRGLVERAPHGIFRATDHGKLVAVNPALVRILGYAREEQLLSLDLARDVFVDTDECDRLMATAAGDTIAADSVEWRRRDGDRITVRLIGRVTEEGSGRRTVEVIVEDVTVQRRMENQHRQIQKMDAIRTLTGGIAHEINNVLAVIIADSELAARSLEGAAPEVRSDLAEIHAVARRGGDLVKKLLGFSRRQELRTTTFVLGEHVRHLIDTLQRLTPADVHVAPGAVCDESGVKADREAIEDILMSLSHNARDAMPHGGEIRISVEPVHLDQAFCRAHPGSVMGDHVRLRVEDTGHGMDPETLRRGFEPFFTTRPRDRAMGLGLSMVYGLVKQMDGYVALWSTMGRGTTVDVYLHRVDVAVLEATDRPQSAVDPGGPAGHETILLVEDEPALRRAASRVLTRAGYHVIAAPDGEAAWGEYEKHRSEIDLVLTDVVMPRLGGVDLYRRLTREASDARVVLMSGYTSGELAAGDIPLQNVPFVLKPWTIPDLLVAVRDACDAPAR